MGLNLGLLVQVGLTACTIGKATSSKTHLNYPLEKEPRISRPVLCVSLFIKLLHSHFSFNLNTIYSIPALIGYLRSWLRLTPWYTGKRRERALSPMKVISRKWEARMVQWIRNKFSCAEKSDLISTQITLKKKTVANSLDKQNKLKRATCHFAGSTFFGQQN